MYEESASAIAPSIWSSINSWFTPTVLFLILNLVIITIAFTSTIANHKHQDNTTNNHKNEPLQPNNIASSLLQRLKSTNFYPHPRSQDPPPNLETESHHYFFQQEINLQPSQPQTHQEIPQETQTHFVYEQKDSNLDGFDQLKVEENHHEEQSIDEVYSQLTGGHFSRTKSDTEPASGHVPPKLPAKMRKSASLKSPFGHFAEEEEEDIVEVRRPATVRERGNARATGGDQEVDAKADDFINKFKQQLKLQRVDSIIRYKEMIGRGSGR